MAGKSKVVIDKSYLRVRNASERKMAQQQLQMVEENYRTIFENSAVAITVADENENIVSWNKFAENLLGMDKDDLYMRPVSSLYPEAEWRKIRSRNVRQKGLQHHLETKIVGKNQKIIEVALSLTVLRGPDRSVIGSIGIIADITQRKTAQQQLQMVEENYRTIFENSAVAITVADEHENIISWNKFAEILLGMDRDDLYMRPVSSLYPVAEWRKMRSQNIRQKGLQHHLETRIIRKDQQIIDVELSLTVLRGPDGKVIGSIGIIADITERKTAQQQLQMVKENYRTVFENSAVAMTVADENENIVSWNKFAEVLLGMDRDDLYMSPVSSLYPEAEWRKMRSQNIRQKGLQHHLETKIIRKNQQIIDVDLSLTVLKGPDGKVSGSIGIIADITQRKMAQQQLQMVGENYRTVFENSAVAITVADENENIISWNKFAGVLLGMDKDDLYMRPVSSLYPEAEWRKMRSQNIRQKGLQHHLETKIVGKNQQIIDVDLSLTVLKGPDGKVSGSIGIIADITQRKKAEEAVLEGEERFRLLIENSLDAIAILNGDGTIRYESPSFERVLGYKPEDHIGKSPFELVHPDDVPNAARAFSQLVQDPGGNLHGEVRIWHKDGSLRTVEVVGQNLLDNPAVAGIVANLRDITERKKVEEALQEAHRELEKRVRQRTSELAKTNQELRMEITERKRAEEAVRETERRYKAIFDNRLQMVYISNEQGVFLDANDYALERLGYTRDDLGKMSFQDVIHPEDHPKALESTLDIWAKGFQEYPIELRLITKSGEIVYVDTFGIPLERGDDHYIELGIAHDITDRKRAEEALQQREQDYLALLESTFEGIVVVDAETLKVVFGNRRASTMFGFDPILKDGVGVNILDLVHPEDKGVVIKGFAEDLYQEERRQTYEVRAKTRDGRELWITALATRTEFQGRLAVLLSTIDVTERKGAEEALRESEEKFRRLVEEMNDGYCVLQGSRVVFANARSAEMFGYEQGEVVGKTVQELLPPEILTELSEMRTKRELGETMPQQYETTLVGKDGTRRPVELGTRVIDYAGEPALSVVVRDITERKQAEEALRHSEEQFRSLIENAQDAIVILNGDGTIRYESPSMERMTGRKAEDRTGKDPSEFSHPDDMPNVIEAFSQLLESQTISVQTELRLRHEDGSWRTFEVVGNNLLDNPAVAGFVLNLRDITERKQAEEEIRSLNEELEQRVIERTTQLEAVNKELEAFAYSVSHDLRAPLRSIDGFSQVLLEDYTGKLDEEGKDHLRRVRSASQRMADLIDDILSLSRVTRGEMRRETVDLSALAQTIATEFQQSQPQRQVEFTLTPGLVTQGDAHLLQAALENLLGNAWKFTNKRSPATIEFGYTETSGQSAYFVRDNGVGFDMAYADKLFGAFQRLHSPNEFEGTGIGLATVQRIIHRHGGNIWAESAVDQGATFYFTL